jgi:hypothetical protein
MGTAAWSTAKIETVGSHCKQFWRYVFENLNQKEIHFFNDTFLGKIIKTKFQSRDISLAENELNFSDFLCASTIATTSTRTLLKHYSYMG